jgi:protein gp37
MSDKTGIAWTDATWNPVTGCAKVSVGCTHCYAEREWPRLSAPGRSGSSVYQGRKFTDVRCHEERLDQPLRWKRPRRIFVNSMSDLFHEDVPDDFLDRVFKVMQTARQHTYQVLTKRPERMQRFLSERVSVPAFTGPFPAMARHIWLGVSVENQAAADERIPPLLATPAAVRLVSAEPLLAPVDLSPWLVADMGDRGRPRLNLLHWVIVGGESGPKARPCEVAWVRSIVEQCQTAGTACFVKQLGAQPRGDCTFRWAHDRDHHPAPEWLDEDGVLPSASGKPPHDLCHAFDASWTPCKPKLRDRSGSDPSEWPDDLRVRQMPEVPCPF